MPVSVKIDQESMTIVEDDAIDEDEVTVCILNTQYSTCTGVYTRRQEIFEGLKFHR